MLLLRPVPSISDPSPPNTSRRVFRVDDHGADMVANLPRGPTPTSYQQSEALTLAFEHEELEVRSVVGKRRMGQGYDYRVRWKDTWLPKSELGSIRRLLGRRERRLLRS